MDALLFLGVLLYYFCFLNFKRESVSIFQRPSYEWNL